MEELPKNEIVEDKKLTTVEMGEELSVSPEDLADKVGKKIEESSNETIQIGTAKIENGLKSLNATPDEINQGKQELQPVQGRIDDLKEETKNKITLSLKKYVTKVMNMLGMAHDSAENNQNVEEKNFLEKNSANIQEIFKLNEELSKIGTPEQYVEYSQTLFPESVAKDIVWHGSKNIFDKFKETDVNFFGLKLNRGTYFSNNLDHANFFTEGKGKLYPARINLVSPYSPNPNHVLFRTSKGDGLMNKNLNDANIARIDQYAVFNPSQIHVLGNTEDREGFKK